MSTHIVYTQMYKWVMDIGWTIRGFGLLGRWTIREDILYYAVSLLLNCILSGWILLLDINVVAEIVKAIVESPYNTSCIYLLA